MILFSIDFHPHDDGQILFDESHDLVFIADGIDDRRNLQNVFWKFLGLWFRWFGGFCGISWLLFGGFCGFGWLGGFRRFCGIDGRRRGWRLWRRLLLGVAETEDAEAEEKEFFHLSGQWLVVSREGCAPARPMVSILVKDKCVLVKNMGISGAGSVKK